MGTPQMCNKFVEKGCEQFTDCCDNGTCRFNDDGSPVTHSLIEKLQAEKCGYKGSIGMAPARLPEYQEGINTGIEKSIAIVRDHFRDTAEMVKPLSNGDKHRWLEVMKSLYISTGDPDRNALSVSGIAHNRAIGQAIAAMQELMGVRGSGALEQKSDTVAPAIKGEACAPKQTCGSSGILPESGQPTSPTTMGAATPNGVLSREEDTQQTCPAPANLSSDASLLPCPWCGSTPKHLEGFNRAYVQCETSGCFMQGVMARPLEWQNRTPEQQSGECWQPKMSYADALAACEPDEPDEPTMAEVNEAVMASYQKIDCPEHWKRIHEENGTVINSGPIFPKEKTSEIPLKECSYCGSEDIEKTTTQIEVPAIHCQDCCMVDESAPVPVSSKE